MFGLQVATDQVARALKVQSGALIQFVSPNSPAASAGLLPTRRFLALPFHRMCPCTLRVIEHSAAGCCLLRVHTSV